MAANMNRKKVTPISLYLKELRKSNSAYAYDMKMAAIKFKSLSVRERDYYEVSAKRINEKNATEVVFTTQRDTLGNNLKEVSEKAVRKAEWDRQSQKIIMDMVSSGDILNKEFVVAKLSGVDFCRSENNETCYATSEICFLKFTLKKGIIDKLVLFPDIINVAAGYRQHLYEDLEENVGWKPETFRNNHSIDETILAIRCFFKGNYCPIFVPTKDHMEEVGLGLHTLYSENRMSCPWIESFDDWGKNCTIYQMEYLISCLLNGDAQNCKDFPSVSVILDFWRNLKVEIAPETCERHMQYGLANQCCTNMLIKYLYGSFLLLRLPGMPDIRFLVSADFYRDLDFIMPMEKQEDKAIDEKAVSSSHWNNYFFEKKGIEEVITSLSGITIKSDSEAISNYKKQVEWGRGRGLARRQDAGNCAVPGSQAGQRKLKLPNVIC